MMAASKIAAMVNTIIRLKTNDGIYTGEVVKLSDESRIVLDKVTCVNSPTDEPTAFSSLITILADDIIDFECLSLLKHLPSAKPAPVSNETVNRSRMSEVIHRLNNQVIRDRAVERITTEPKDACPTTVTRLTPLLDAKCIPFDDTDVHGVENDDKRPKQYVIVDSLDDMFNEAISLIKFQAMIGLGLDGVELGRHGQLCWIQISTKEMVLLFDILSLNSIDDAFDNGFREIFESPKILKILHDCRAASDILHHQYDTTLKNVYDTQVADVMVFRSKNSGTMPHYVRSLNVVLVQFLRLSESEVAFYQIRKSSVERDTEIWRRRPQSSLLCRLAALNVRYLRELRLATLESILQDFIHGVGLYLDYREADPSNGLVIQNDTNLPKEFLVFGPFCGRGSRPSNYHTAGEALENLTLGCNINGHPVANPQTTEVLEPRLSGNGPSPSSASSHWSQEIAQFRGHPSNVEMYPAGMNLQSMEEALRRRGRTRKH